MNCIITVKAGTSNSAPKTTKTAPLEDFIVDSDYVYSRVYQHVKSCGKCSPNDVVQAYLGRRKSLLKFKGRTSGGLVKLALKYASLPSWIPEPSLIREMIWRTASIGTLQEYETHLGGEDVLRGMRIAAEAHGEWCKSYGQRLKLRNVVEERHSGSRFFALMHACATVYDATGSLQIDGKELQNLAVVCDVMTA